MTPELERAVKYYRQWFGPYKKSGELVKVQVWLTINNGSIEFLTLDDSYKLSQSQAKDLGFEWCVQIDSGKCKKRHTSSQGLIMHSLYYSNEVRNFADIAKRRTRNYQIRKSS
jgi:hypothetical protein